MDNLIVIKQLPVLEDRFKALGDEIQSKVDMAKSLVCTEETCKDVKKTRAELNKQAKAYEEEFKSIKTQCLSPWEKVELAYKSNVKDKYQTADKDLKSKIDDIESAVKAEKEQNVKSYFNEYLADKNIDFVTYESARINVTLSASMKSLKEQAKDFIDRICDDLALIETQEHKAEIMVEYKKTLNCSQAITTVSNRIKAIEEQKQQEEQRKKWLEKQRAKREEQLKEFAEKKVQQEPLHAPVVEKSIHEPTEVPAVEEKIYSMSFTVKGTVAQLKRVKEFLIDGGYDYE